MAHSGLVPRHLHLGGSILDVTVVKVVVGVVLQPHLAEVAVGTVLREKMTAAIGTMIDVTATVLEARMIETGR